jgi:hypothetical protein
MKALDLLRLDGLPGATLVGQGFVERMGGDVESPDGFRPGSPDSSTLVDFWVLRVGCRVFRRETDFDPRWPTVVAAHEFFVKNRGAEQRPSVDEAKAIVAARLRQEVNTDDAMKVESLWREEVAAAQVAFAAWEADRDQFVRLVAEAKAIRSQFSRWSVEARPSVRFPVVEADLVFDVERAARWVDEAKVILRRAEEQREAAVSARARAKEEARRARKAPHAAVVHEPPAVVQPSAQVAPEKPATLADLAAKFRRRLERSDDL